MICHTSLWFIWRLYYGCCNDAAFFLNWLQLHFGNAPYYNFTKILCKCWSYRTLFYTVQELTPAPVYPLVVGVSVIALFISMPRYPSAFLPFWYIYLFTEIDLLGCRWKDLLQALVGLSASGSTKKDIKKLNVRKKTYWNYFVLLFQFDHYFILLFQSIKRWVAKLLESNVAWDEPPHLAGESLEHCMQWNFSVTTKMSVSS